MKKFIAVILSFGMMLSSINAFGSENLEERFSVTLVDDYKNLVACATEESDDEEIAEEEIVEEEILEEQEFINEDVVVSGASVSVGKDENASGSAIDLMAANAVNYECNDSEGKYKLVIDYDYIWSSGNGGTYAQVRTIQPLDGHTLADEGTVRVPSEVDVNGTKIPVISIKKSAFEACGAKKIIIPDTVHDIEDQAFWKCNSLEEVEILGKLNPNKEIRPTDVKVDATGKSSHVTATMVKMGDSTMANCPNLKTVKINGFMTIGNNTFENCTALTDVTFTLDDCYAVSNSTVNENTKLYIKLGEATFKGCTALKNMYFNNSNKIQTVGKGSFSGCTALETVTLSDTLAVTNMNYDMFEGCKNLKMFINDPNTGGYKETSKLVATDDCLYTKDSKKLILYPNKRADLNLVIPDTCTEIGEKAVYGVENIKSASIPEGKVAFKIGIRAFSTSNIETLETGNRTDPTAIISAEANCFENCQKIRSINSGAYFKAKDYAFKESSIQTVKARTLSAGKYCFDSSKISSVTTTDGWGTLNDYAFNNCLELTSIDLTNVGRGVTPGETVEFKTYVFNNCASLRSVSMPDLVVGISSGTFSGCTALTDVNYTKDGSEIVQLIGSKAFENCISLRSLPTFRFLVRIDPNAFLNCKDLNITLTRSVMFLFETSFADCTNIKISAPTTSEAWAAVEKYKSSYNATLTPIADDIKDEEFLMRGYVARKIYNPAANKLMDTMQYEIVGYKGGFKTLTIPDTDEYKLPMSNSWIKNSLYQSVNNRADCSMVDVLESIDFGSVTDIGAKEGSSLSGCSKLKNVTIRHTTEKIGNNTFSGCSALKNVDIEEGLKHIGNGAFLNCRSIESITLPSTLDEIQDIYTFNTSISAIGLLDAIGNDAFKGCTSLVNVIFTQPTDKKVKKKVSFGSGAFANTALREIDFPYFSYNVGEKAFSGCKQLEYVRFSPNTLDVKVNAFENCTALPSIVVEKAMFIDDYAFKGCTNISRVVVPPSANIPGFLAFSDCDKESTYFICSQGSEADKTITSNGYKVTYAEFDESYEYTTIKRSVTFPDSIVVMRNGEKLANKAAIYTNDILTISFANAADAENYKITVNGVLRGNNYDYKVNNIDNVVIDVVEFGSATGVYGDVNGNGVVDISDVGYVYTKAINDSIDLGIDNRLIDVDLNGIVSVEDCSYLYTKAINDSYQMPVEKAGK